MSSPVRFGIIGCGVIAATHADALEDLADAELTAICDIRPDQALAFAEKYRIARHHVYFDLAAFLADTEIDAVCVCTPSGTHARIGAECLWAGYPVIVEKPMDVNLDAILLLNAAQQETGLPLSIISQHRFDAASVYTHRLIEGGYLGSLVLCEAQVKWYRSQDYYDSGDWRGTWKLDGGGALMNQGVHTVDLMRWMMGPVHSIYASARTLAHQDIEVEDAICATINFENGAVGNLIASTAAYPGYPAQLSIHGTDGSVVISGDSLIAVDLIGDRPIGTEAEILLAAGIAGHAIDVAQGGTRTAEGNKILTPPTGAATKWGDAHRAQIADFINSVRNGTSPIVDGTAGMEAVRIVIAAYESANTGKIVELA